MGNLSTRLWWGDSVEIPLVSLPQCKQLKTTWESGGTGNIRKWILAINGFSSPDFSLTTLQVVLDFSLNMNPQMCPIGLITLVHVEAILQPLMGLWPHHPTQATTQLMQTAYTPSLSPLEPSLFWNFLSWIFLSPMSWMKGNASTKGTIHQLVIT